jgi:hypothetical protein
MTDRTPRVEGVQDRPATDLIWASPPVESAPQWSSAGRRTGVPSLSGELAGAVAAHALAGMSQGYHTAPAPVLGVDLPAPRRGEPHVPDTFKAHR